MSLAEGDREMQPSHHPRAASVTRGGARASPATGDRPRDRRMLRIKGAVDSACGRGRRRSRRVDIDDRMRGVMRYADGRSRGLACSQTAEGATLVSRASLRSHASPPTLGDTDDAVGHRDGQDEYARHDLPKAAQSGDDVTPSLRSGTRAG